MPILVQWKWEERTKSFLVVFHFYDDFSKPNLRMRVYKAPKVRAKAVLTWAPSHVELGLLSDILRYANIIDGLDEAVKRKLREKLELLEMNGSTLCDWETFKELQSALPEDSVVEISLIAKKGIHPYIETELGRLPPIERIETAVILCPEYIDYLRKVLNSYLRSC
jgi:hypothetical protein